MDPRIHYATTADREHIAYWVMGEGPPLFHLTAHPYGHAQMELEDPDFRSWYNGLSRHFRVIRLDLRGSGLSSRNPGELTMEAFVLDIEAVRERLGIDRFILLGAGGGTTPAILYTAKHPERIERLITWCGWSSAAEVRASPARALVGPERTDWQLYAQTMARAFVAGWDEPERGARVAEIMLAAADTPTLTQLMALDFDVEPLLPSLAAPTLVLHRRALAWPPLAAAQRIARLIPDAELVALDGTAFMPWVGDMDGVLRTIEEFAGVASSAPAAGAAATNPLRILLFTDIEGHTEMMSRLGDERGRAVLREHEQITREALRQHGGVEVKSLGDGFMASFDSAQRALECAAHLQRTLADSPMSGDLRVRVGLNAGEPIADDGDLFGAAVIAAARIASEAAGGQVLAANVVRELAAGKGFLFREAGKIALKGMEEPIRLWEMSWRAG